MNNTISISMIVTLVLFIGTFAIASEEAPQELVDLANSEMAKLGDDPIIIEAVMAQNSKGMTMDQIKEMDEKWEDAEETDEIVKAVIANACAQHLNELLDANPALEDAEEFYVMDRQGALVSSIKLEETYWWGEDKGFTQALQGSVHVSDFILDEDENEYLVYVSIPVRDNGQIAGVIIVGIEVDE